jgi:pSer/pThr/pTyr-binding forkhead associated (FHA) protein
MVQQERREGGPVPPGTSICVLSGFFEGLEVPVDRDWLVIGRGRGADVVIAEPTLSRAHVAIGFEEEAFFVQDLGSTNGTLVNGAREQKAHLKDGDEIQIGKLILQINLPK